MQPSMPPFQQQPTQQHYGQVPMMQQHHHHYIKSTASATTLKTISILEPLSAKKLSPSIIMAQPKQQTLSASYRNLGGDTFAITNDIPAPTSDDGDSFSTRMAHQSLVCNHLLIPGRKERFGFNSSLISPLLANHSREFISFHALDNNRQAREYFHTSAYVSYPKTNKDVLPVLP